MPGFFFGVVFAAFLIFIVSIIPGSKVYDYNKAIDECEKNLPRSQECVITAIPKAIDNK